MTNFSEEQIKAVRNLINPFLSIPLSHDEWLGIISGSACEGSAPAIRSRKKRYVIAIINAIAETIEDPDQASDCRHRVASAFGIGPDLLRTESAKIDRHSRKNDAVKEKLYDLMDKVRHSLGV